MQTCSFFCQLTFPLIAVLNVVVSTSHSLELTFYSNFLNAPPSAICLPGLFRHLSWAIYGNHPALVKTWHCEGQPLASPGSKTVDACPIVSFEWTYVRCILPGFQMVPEGSGPSSPLITTFVCIDFPCFRFSHPSLPLQFPEITSQNKLLHTNPCFSLYFLEGILAETPSEKDDGFSF